MKVVLEVTDKLKNGDLLYYENDTLKAINKIALLKNVEDKIIELENSHNELENQLNTDIQKVSESLQSQLDSLKIDVSKIASILKENI